MSRIATLGAFLAGGACISFATALLVRHLDAQVPSAPPAAPDPRLEEIATIRSRLDTALDRLGVVEKDFAALRERLEHVEREPAPETKKTSPALKQAPPPKAPATGSVLDPSALLRRAKWIAQVPARHKEAMEILARVAAQAKDPALRADAWLQQGNLYWVSNDYKRAADVWRKAIDAVGLDSATGQTACFQLEWALSKSNDWDGAYKQSTRLMKTPGISKLMYGNARLASGIFAASKHDAAAARRLFQGIIDDYTNDSDQYFRLLASQARQCLTQLR